MTIAEEKYIDFASKISFFEFIQDEFRKSKIKAEDFKSEIRKLAIRKNWNIGDLSDFIKMFPRSFLIFQEVFQLLRFTNAQLIHFIFDIDKLNSLNLNSIFEYLVLNLKNDECFQKLFLASISKGLTYKEFFKKISTYDKKYLVAMFKASISKYIDLIIKDFEILETRIEKKAFDDFYIRLSNYLLENQKLNETLSSINLYEYIKYKKIPNDTKGIHGNYPRIRITKILEKNGFKCIDNILSDNKVKTLEHNIAKQLGIKQDKNQKMYCTEKYVKGVIKPKDKKSKKFDLIIFKNSVPKYLFEINFYSTTGTKIGINQNEYIDVNNYIKKNFRNLKFYWITDGNYWLKKDGKTRFLNLLNYFDSIYNINLFSEKIEKFT